MAAWTAGGGLASADDRTATATAEDGGAPPPAAPASDSAGLGRAALVPTRPRRRAGGLS